MLRKWWFQTFVLVVTGAVSGATLLKGTGDASSDGLGLSLWFGPGIWFGLGMALLWWGRFKARFGGMLVWFLGSIGAWYLAIMAYFKVNVGAQEGIGGLFNMMAAGLVGGVLLAILAALVVRRVGLPALVFTVAAGPVLAALMNAVMSTSLQGSDSSVVRLAVAFAVWQAGIGLILVRLAQPEQLNLKP